jgi:5-methylcytosine-specific restriction enzyme A
MRDQGRSPQAMQWRRLYNSARWQGVRAEQLRKVPLCEACRDRGEIVKATVCNHSDPASKATTEGFFRGPFSSLCVDCHDLGETRVESFGYSGEADAEGWPIDPRHPANRERGAPRPVAIVSRLHVRGTQGGDPAGGDG